MPVRQCTVSIDPTQLPWTIGLLGLAGASGFSTPLPAAALLPAFPEATIGLPPSYRIVQLGNAHAMKETINC